MKNNKIKNYSLSEHIIVYMALITIGLLSGMGAFYMMMATFGDEYFALVISLIFSSVVTIFLLGKETTK
jgi:hypothetical protein